MNRRTSYKLRQLGIIMVVWLIIGFIIPFYDRPALITMNAVPPVPRYTMLQAIIINMGAAFTGALLVEASGILCKCAVQGQILRIHYPGRSRSFPGGDRDRQYPAAPVQHPL